MRGSKLLGLIAILLVGLLLPPAAFAYTPEFPPWIWDAAGHPPNVPPPQASEETSEAPLDTSIDKSKVKPHKRAVTLTFHASEPGVTFQCKLDGGQFLACRSPKTYGSLRPGRHRFAVAAVDNAGTVDDSPAETYLWIPKPKKTIPSSHEN